MICTDTKALVLLGALLFGSAMTYEAQAQNLRLSTHVNEADVRFSGFKYFAELVSKKTGGRITVTIYPAETLHSFTEAVDAILGGVTDISSIQPGESRLPCFRATGPYPAIVALDRQLELDHEYLEFIKPEAAKIDLIPIMSSSYTYDLEWFFKQPITDLTKLDGQLVRTLGPLTSLMIETWGGKPVFIAPKEIYQSAERGVVSGINMGVSTFSSWKLWNVMPHMVRAGLFYGNILIMMKKSKFDALSQDDQRAILAAGREMEIWLKPRYESWINEQIGDAVMKHGATASALPRQKREALINSIKGKWDKVVDKGCGLEGAKKFRTLMEKYAR